MNAEPPKSAFVDLFKWAEIRLVRESRPVSARALVAALSVEGTKDIALTEALRLRLTSFRALGQPVRLRKAERYLVNEPPA